MRPETDRRNGGPDHRPSYRTQQPGVPLTMAAANTLRVKFGSLPTLCLASGHESDFHAPHRPTNRPQGTRKASRTASTAASIKGSRVSAFTSQRKCSTARMAMT